MKYSNTGWYIVEDGFWAHLRGTVERGDRIREGDRRLRYWVAKPHGGPSMECRTIRDAKTYVEEHGKNEDS